MVANNRREITKWHRPHAVFQSFFLPETRFERFCGYQRPSRGPVPQHSSVDLNSCLLLPLLILEASLLRGSLTGKGEGYFLLRTLESPLLA